MTLDAAILAGGRSRRMGQDKALLIVDGERLVDRVLRRLTPLGGGVVLVRGDRDPIPSLPIDQIPDRLRDAGPMAGIEAALGHLETELVAVIAVDLPGVSAAVLTCLVDLWDGRSPAVIPEVGGRLQPLHAVWARAAEPALKAALDAGERSPTAFAAASGAQIAGVEIWGRVDADGRFARNLNWPADLER